PQAEYWRSRVFDDRLHLVQAPVAMVSGWHDIFLPAQLRDYQALRATGARPRLVVGPWTHGSPGPFVAALREGLTWLGGHVAGDPAGVLRGDAAGVEPAAAAADASGARGEAPVRVHVGGAGGGWRDLRDWPPPADAVRWYLHPGATLSTSEPVPSP